MNKTSARAHRPRQFWQQTVAQYRASGLSRRAFAQQHDIKPSTLSRWVRTLEGENLSMQPQLIEVVAASIEPAPTPNTARLLIGDAIVEFAHLPAPTYLAQLLREVS